MDDDDDVSAGSRSPDSPHQNRRITVTVASSAAAAAQPMNTLTLALPIQQQHRGGGGGGGGGREDCWSEGATSVLIDAWGERYVELSRGNLKQKHWKEVADIVSSREDYSKPPKTDIQCKNRIDTVKKKYKLEKSKIASGGGPSKWSFYDRLDELIGPTAKISAPVGHGVGGAGKSYVSPLLKSVPMGIPVGVRSDTHTQQFKKHQMSHTRAKPQMRRRRRADSEESESEPEPSADSTDEDTYEQKRPRVQAREVNLGGVRSGGEGVLTGKDKDWGNSVRELTRAILKFGEAYEQAESSKLQQLVEMEKQRMKFAKELELQRMQFFMKTQLELSQLKSRRVGNNSNNHQHHGNINSNNANNHHSDSND